MVGDFANKGWARFGPDPKVLDWSRHALPVARAAVNKPELAHWLHCQGTWFVGVDALPNDENGRIGKSLPLSGDAVDFIGAMPSLHPAQISVVYPGYPRPRQGESPGAFRYRSNRDAAHVDGIRAVGPAKRRKLREPHAFILGLPLMVASADAAPLVVWEGSHEIMRTAFAAAFKGQKPEQWPDFDVTEVYQTARRRVFDTCTRVPLPAVPGEAVLLHRLVLHGIAPWADSATADRDGRMIAYFRPELPGGVRDWLAAP